MGILTPFVAGQPIRASDLNNLPVVASVMALGSVTNSNAETVVGTFTIAGGLITAVNQGIRWKALFSCGGTGSPNLTFRVRTGGLAGTLIAQIGPSAITSASAWVPLEGWMLFSAVGTSGTFGGLSNLTQAFAGGSPAPAAGQVFDVYNAISWNTTIANTIVVTAQFSVANAANVAAGLSGVAYPE